MSGHRQRDPHAQPPADAARDRVEARRRRLLELTGREPDPGLEDFGPALERVAENARAKRLADLSPAIAGLGRAYADAARGMADALGVTPEDGASMAATAAALGAFAPAAVRKAWELGELVERAKAAGVDIDAVLEVAGRHPTQAPGEALEQAIARRELEVARAAAPAPLITTAAELARRQCRGRGIDLPNGWRVTLDALVDVAPTELAPALDLDVDEFLEYVERWAAGVGAPYGIRVDREAGTITQAGA
jgi:hypothetical protein